MFAERLKELRDKNKMSQVELSKILNVAKQTVSNWENGNRTPDNEMLIRIANYFDVSVDYLIGRTDCPNHSLLTTEYKNKNIELVINSKNSSYSQEQIQNLIDKLASMYVDVEKLIDK